MTTDSQGLTWQIGVWDQISQIYRDEIDPRFEPVVDGLLRRADLRGGERVLDLGTGTGAVAAKAAALVADEGLVLAIDISPEMLDCARQRSEGGSARFQVREAAAEAIPAGDNAFDVILASLSLMYVIDRAAAARELARVLRPGGRPVGALRHPGSGRDRSARIRLRRLRQRMGRAGRRHDRATAIGTTARSQSSCARGDVAGSRRCAKFPQHRPVHRRRMSRRGRIVTASHVQR